MTTWSATRRSCNSAHPADSSAPAAAVLAAILWALASPNPPWVLAAANAGAVVGCILIVGTPMTARFEYDPATRDLRHQARQETRTAARLQALESAGWVLLHDRLVVAHRVPHILVGLPADVSAFITGTVREPGGLRVTISGTPRRLRSTVDVWVEAGSP